MKTKLTILILLVLLAIGGCREREPSLQFNGGEWQKFHDVDAYHQVDGTEANRRAIEELKQRIDNLKNKPIDL